MIDAPWLAAAQQQEITERLSAIPDLAVHVSYPLAGRTSFRVGGNADWALFPSSEPALSQVIQLAGEYAVPLTVLGCGSNVLISDQGIRGFVLVLSPGYAQITREGNIWRCRAGTPLYELAAESLVAAQTGAEFLAGIPGSMGGAVMMNAGAYDACMADIVVKVRYLDTAGQVQTIAGSDLQFSYRHSFFSNHPAVISEIELALVPGEREAIYHKMADLQARRRRSQPLDYPSAGSSFKRPAGNYAGKLITDAGLKGWRCGAAGVSAKHAGFIVNYGGATAQEIWHVFEVVRDRVYCDSGICLEPEVKQIGDWT